MYVANLLVEGVRADNSGTVDKQASADDEEGRVALVSPSVEHLEGTSPGIALLDTEIPASMRRSKPKKNCCMCCGME